MKNYLVGEDDQNQSQDSNINLEGQEQLDELEWSMQNLVRALRLLTDNFSAFKSAGASGIKLPNVKLRKGY